MIEYIVEINPLGFAPSIFGPVSFGYNTVEDSSYRRFAAAFPAPPLLRSLAKPKLALPCLRKAKTFFLHYGFLIFEGFQSFLDI